MMNPSELEELRALRRDVDALLKIADTYAGHGTAVDHADYADKMLTELGHRGVATRE